MHSSLCSRTGVALGVLSSACFISVTSENLPVAVLPQLAPGLGVSESAVGLLVTGYAVAVGLTVVPLVAMTARWDRRTTALITVAAITVSNLLLAVAPSYAVAVAARMVAAVGHGVFWSVVAPMAARLLGPERSGRATAVVFAGNSLAFLLGLPLSSWLGATIGWRPTALLVAGLAALSALLIRMAIEPMPPERPPARRSARAVLRTVADRPLVAVNVTTLVTVTGQFTAFTFITVIIADYVRLTGSATSLLLLAHGAAGLLGLLIVGHFVDRSPRLSALAVTAGLAACMLVLMSIGSVSPVVAAAAVVLWAMPTAGIAVVLQAAVLRNATHQPDLASAGYIVAFQTGIALGAFVGGVCLDQGHLAVAVATAAACGVVASVVVRRSASFADRPASPKAETPAPAPQAPGPAAKPT